MRLGLRPSEALGLSWGSVDLDAGTLRVVEKLVTPVKGAGDPYLEAPKSKAGVRMLALSPALVVILRKHLAEQEAEQAKAEDAWRDNGLVFCDAYGRALRGDSLNHTFHRLTEAAGLPTIRLYDLRRLAAALVLAATSGDLAEAKAQLGHSSITLAADTYGYRLTEQAAKTAKKVGDLLSGVTDAPLEYPLEPARTTR